MGLFGCEPSTIAVSDVECKQRITEVTSNMTKVLNYSKGKTILRYSHCLSISIIGSGTQFGCQVS